MSASVPALNEATGVGDGEGDAVAAGGDADLGDDEGVGVMAASPHADATSNTQRHTAPIAPLDRFTPVVRMGRARG